MGTPTKMHVSRMLSRVHCVRRVAQAPGIPSLLMQTRPEGGHNEALRLGFRGLSTGREEDEKSVKSHAPAAIPALTVGAATIGSITPSLCGATAEALSPGALYFLSTAPVLACQVLWMAPLPTIRTVQARGTTESLPPLPYFSMATNGYLWVAYGAAAGMDMTIMVPNLTGMLFGSYYCSQFIKYNSKEHNLQPYYAGSAAIVALVTGAVTMLPMATAQQVLGYTGCAVVVAMFSGPLQVIRKVLDDKSTRSLPFPMAIATTVNCICWGSYGWIVIEDPFVYLPNSLGLAAGLAQLSLFARFGIQSAADDDTSSSSDPPKKYQHHWSDYSK